MGQVQSIAQTNSMQVVNNISQISNEKCINLCTDNSHINMSVINSTVKNITLGTYCSVNGASCTLKSSLTDKVSNILTSTQNSKIKDEEDPSNFLNTLAELGSSQTVIQANSQRVTNNITQQMNSVCMNKVMNNAVLNMNIVNAKVGNVDYTTNHSVSNTTCVIDNMAANTTNNSLTNSQTASIVKEGMFGGLGILIAIVAVVMLKHHKKKNKEELEKHIAGYIPGASDVEEASKIGGEIIKNAIPPLYSA